MDQFLEHRFWGNSVLTWIIAAAIIVIATVAIRLLRHFVGTRLRRWAAGSAATWDDFLIRLLDRSVIPLCYVAACYAAVQTLRIPPRPSRWIYIAFLAIGCFWVLRIISAAVKWGIGNVVKRRGSGEGMETQASGLIFIINAVIWVLGVIFLIDNLGYNVTTLVAGLGIGGIAIALAAQTILGDLFSYFVIFFDRPFEIGDFITVGSEAGIVEHIGIKTTRIRTLTGQQLICSNTYLTNAQVHNYKRLQKRRIVFTIGVTYQTPQRQLAAIPGMIKDIIASFDRVEADRGHLSGFGDSQINFEFVYHVLDPDYTIYMDHQQAIYLRIAEAFEREGIEFAYPTRTLIIQPPGPVAG